MHFAPTHQSGSTVSNEGHAIVGDPRRMTRSQLRQLGVSMVVYLRSGTRDGQVAFAIHAADGNAMAIVDDIDLAVELVSEQGLVFVSVH
jgi:hypothetical protein